MALTRAQYLSGNTFNGVVLPGQPQGVRPGGAGITIAADGTISVNAATLEGVVRLNNDEAFNAYVWPGAAPSNPSGLVSDSNGNLSWVRFGGGGDIGTVTSINVSGGSTGMAFSGGPITSSGTITMGGVLSLASGGTGETTASAAINALLPPQAAAAGQFLSTNGTNVLWEEVRSGVTKIIAGDNITISPTDGTGDVTINGASSLNLIDDISSQFDGTKVAFTVTSGGSALNTSVNRIILSVGGIIQSPTTSFSYDNSTSQITFTEAPPTGASFVGWAA